MKYKFEHIATNSTAKKLPEESDRKHYIGLEHLDTNCFTISRWGSDVTPVGEKLLMKKGDVLFGKRRAYQRKVGIAPFDGIFSAHGMVLRPKEDVIDKDFFPFFINSDQFMERAIRISVGGLSPTINWKDLKEQVFELPSLEEQKVLASKLWAAYNLKESYKILLAKTDELVKSRFIELFSGDSIPRVPLADLCTLFIDGDWIEAKDQSDSGYRLVQTGNIGNCEYLDKEDHSRYVSDETFKRLNCTEIHSGDILFSRLPDPIGRCCIIPMGFPKAITAVDCTITRLKDNCLPEYLMVYTTTTMYSEQIKKCITGTTRQRISRGNLAKISVPLPDKQRQAAFVSLVHQADKSKFELKQAIEKIDKVMRALLQ